MEKIHTLRVRLSKFMNPVGEKRITQKAVAQMIGYKKVDIHRFVNNTLKSYKSDMIDKLWELVDIADSPHRPQGDAVHLWIQAGIQSVA